MKEEKLDQYDFPWDKDEVIFAKEEEYAKEIGGFLIAFSNLESAVNVLIADGISDRSHDLGYKIVKHLKYRNKIELAKELYIPVINSIPVEKIRKKSAQEFERIFTKLVDLGEFRNKVAHANWMSLNKSGYVRTTITSAKDGSIKFKKVIITPKNLSCLGTECYSIATHVYHLSERLFKRLLVK